MGIFKNSPSPLVVFFMSPKMNNEKTHPPESRPHPQIPQSAFQVGLKHMDVREEEKRGKKGLFGL